MATTATVAVTAVGPPSTAPQHQSEEEAAKKKNTDCVYFLASPLTCKKGDECEFRHSESARLNPRDCWFWVAGNCRNRECPFRHPPLETRPAAPAPSPPVHQKKPVPCFFFSQGCCAKGSKCQYLHESATSNAMVYRLSDSSKPPPAADPSKAKPAKEESEPVQQQSTTPREHTPDKRKDNVYRLQGKAAAGPSRESFEDEQLPGKQRSGKSHKESYTWKLSDSPATQKQPTVDGKDQQRKPEKPVRGNANNTNNNNTSSSKRRESRTESSRSSDRTQVVDSGEVNEDFAGPKSLAQIKEEKRKVGDVEDTGSAPAVKFKRKSAPVEGGDEKAEHVRRRLCNGSDATTATATAITTTTTITTAATKTTTTATATENGGDVEMSSAELAAGDFHVEYAVDYQQQEDEDDDDFARRIGGLFS